MGVREEALAAAEAQLHELAALSQARTTGPRHSLTTPQAIDIAKEGGGYWRGDAQRGKVPHRSLPPAATQPPPPQQGQPHEQRQEQWNASPTGARALTAATRTPPPSLQHGHGPSRSGGQAQQGHGRHSGDGSSGGHGQPSGVRAPHERAHERARRHAAKLLEEQQRAAQLSGGGGVFDTPVLSSFVRAGFAAGAASSPQQQHRRGGLF